MKKKLEDQVSGIYKDSIIHSLFLCHHGMDNKRNHLVVSPASLRPFHEMCLLFEADIRHHVKNRHRYENLGLYSEKHIGFPDEQCLMAAAVP
jgi:hypothetical protein